MATPKDAAQFFDVMVPAVLAKYPDRFREVNAVIVFKITGDSGGEWTMDLTATPATCTHDANEDAQCTITVAHEDFKSMLVNPQVGMQLYFQNKLLIGGDPSLVIKLFQLLTPGLDASRVGGDRTLASRGRTSRRSGPGSTARRRTPTTGRRCRWRRRSGAAGRRPSRT